MTDYLVEVERNLVQKLKTVVRDCSDAIEAMEKAREFLRGRYGEEAKSYSYTKVVREMVQNKYNVEISSSRLGRLLKKKGFDHRMNPDSEYRLRA